MRNICCREEERGPDGLSSTLGKVLKILPVCSIRVLQMVRAVEKFSSVQISTRMGPIGCKNWYRE